MRTIVWVSAIVGLLAAAPGAYPETLRTHETPGLGEYDVPFWPDGAYRDDVKSPSEFLGRLLGAYPASHAEVLGYFRYLADDFSNVSLHTYAETYEGRALVYLVVASDQNAARLDEIRANTAKLADPRTLGGTKPQDLIASTPATAYMSYGIHGDELSSCDAALQLAYQLIAGTDSTSQAIRDNVVVLIDPMENPDGRMRWLKQVEQWNGAVPNGDVQSFQHRGLWPWGRGNHYLFDLNRDWFAQVHPESRGRTRAILEWNPQYLLDCHEMGPTETYLFSPPREPFNPFMVSHIYKWWDLLAKDHAAAFDRYGWSYYTREWNEEFYPGYGSSWGIYTGAIGMLYEQASVDGSFVKRPDGTVMTYRETVHHQFVSSMANLGSIAAHREQLLRDYYDEKRTAAGLGDRGGRPKGGAFLFPPSRNAYRLGEFAKRLVWQNIDIAVAGKPFKVKNAVSSMKGDVKSRELPEGTLIVDVNQPMRALIEAILTFEIRMPTGFLETERKELLKKNQTRLYEATAWSFPLAYGLESYYVDTPPRVETTPYAIPTPQPGRLVGRDPQFGYAVDLTDDRSYAVLARLFERGARVWSALKSFEVDDRVFPPGSLVIRAGANRDLGDSDIQAIAAAEGVDIYTVDTALGGRLADLGGEEFKLLEVPRIGIVGGPGTSTSGFGVVWHLLDSRLRYKTTTLEAGSLRSLDLRTYNVIVLPEQEEYEEYNAEQLPDAYEHMLGDDGVDKLRAWVEAGGTLVAIGNAAAFCADSSIALSTVRQRRQVLETLGEYDRARALAAAADAAEVDSLDLWEAKPHEKTPPAAVEKPSVEDIKHADEVARVFRPRGVIMAADLDKTHFLAFGVPSPAPVMVNVDYAYLTKRPVQVAARFAPAARLRLSGLLWPEARARWSETAYATREGVGNGQVILFAYVPNFRAFFHVGERMLLNALFLGPGNGTRTPVSW